MNRYSSVLIRKVRPNSLRFATSEERIEGLSTNLSILGKSKGNAPITIDCIDLHQHPSADVALFELDPMHSRAQERSDPLYQGGSGSEIDIHSTGEDGVQAQVSVYSKIKIRAEDGFTKVSSLEAPSVNIRSRNGDIELNSIKIANSILGESVFLRSEGGNITMNKRTLGDVTCLTHGNVNAGTIQSLKIDVRGNDVAIQSAYAGSGIIRAHNNLTLKNLNGDFDVEVGNNVLIDGCDGSIAINKSNSIDIHVDSSLKEAKLVADEKVKIRTPPESNGHKFIFKNCGKITIDKRLAFEKSGEEQPEGWKSIILKGENKAGHERKVATIDFGGLIEVEGAKEVHLEAESWMEKQLAQAKRFGESKQDSKMAEQKGFRFY